MHLFHKYKTIKTERRKIIANGFLTRFKDVEEEVVYELKQCSCGKKKAFLHYLNGVTKEVHPGFLEGL